MKTSLPEDRGRASQTADNVLATAAHAARTSLHPTLGLSRGALVFNRNMLLDIQVVTDWEALQQKRHHMIKKNLDAAIIKRATHHDCDVGDKVLKLVHRPDKLEPCAEGPFPMTRVHVNGNVTMQKTTLTTGRTNTRRAKPHCEPKRHISRRCHLKSRSALTEV